MRRPAAPFRRSRRTPIVIGLVLCYLVYAHLPSSNPRIKYVPSSFDWSTLTPRYPAPNPAALPHGSPLSVPKIQHDFTQNPPTKERQQILSQRRAEVKRAFTKSWNAYKRYAWLHDELAPLTATSHDPFGGWAATLVDSLDTLWIMDLKDDFHLAVAAVGRLDWSITSETACNFFETTIRHLGGLLSAYDLSHEPVLLKKAVELGDMLLTAFDTPTHFPPFWLDFEKAKTGQLVAGTHDPSASVASSSLEFTRLAQITGDGKYYAAIDRVTQLLELTQNITKLPGMWPTFFDMSSPLEKILAQETSWSYERGFTLGALADSLYEYLPKMHYLLASSGGAEDGVYEKLWKGAAETIQKNLLFRPMLPDREDILFSGTAWVDSDGIKLDAEGQHLTCFVGGMFGLAGKLFGVKEHVDLAERLARGCSWAYDSFPTGIMPEIFNLVACPGFEACAWDEEAGMPHWTPPDEDEDDDKSSSTNGNLKGRNSANGGAQQKLAGGNRAKSKWEGTTTTQKESKQLPLRKGFLSARDPRYLLRPEALESIFLMYRMTGKQYYQDVAWKMFQSIIAATETDLAFSAIRDVNVAPRDGSDYAKGSAGKNGEDSRRRRRSSSVTEKSNSMESFWLAETLKYAYLTFADEGVISLDEWVLNTEAHPFRVHR